MKRYTIANNFSCEYGQGQFNRDVSGDLDLREVNKQSV